MIKVVDKIFAVLEAIAANSPEPSAPQMLAEQLGINRTTCSRLLKELLDAGYIIRCSRKQGYLPGPRILTLSNISSFQERLLEKARPVVDRCAYELKNSVLISYLHDGNRYVLYHRNGNPGVEVILKGLCYDDIFYTAAGLLLVSHLPEPEQRALHKAKKAAGAGFFPSAEREEDAIRLLKKIREEDFFIVEKNGKQRIYAYPVYENGVFIAVIGICIPANEYSVVYNKKILRTMKKASEEITLELSALRSIG